MPAIFTSDYILAYIPFNSHETKWISRNLNILKQNYKNIKDERRKVMDWGVIEFYLVLLYADIFYGHSFSHDGLRISPYTLLRMINNKC